MIEHWSSTTLLLPMYNPNGDIQRHVRREIWIIQVSRSMVTLRGSLTGKDLSGSLMVADRDSLNVASRQGWRDQSRLVFIFTYLSSPLLSNRKKMKIYKSTCWNATSRRLCSWYRELEWPTRRLQATLDVRECWEIRGDTIERDFIITV